MLVYISKVVGSVVLSLSVGNWHLWLLQAPLISKKDEFLVDRLLCVFFPQVGEWTGLT